MRSRIVAMSLAILVSGAPAFSGATSQSGPSPRGGVSSTVHNLSVSGPGDLKAQGETEVCKFCHIPHSPVVSQPLWGHVLSDVKGYKTAKIRKSGGRVENAPQPDGASRLCLSCHDGTVALGEIGRSRRPISMAGSQRMGQGRPGFIGTDLSGAHPISIPMPDTVSQDDAADMGIRPAGAIVADPSVHLDSNKLMQCTTCHDPHSDSNYQPGRTPHFWVKPTVTEVCLSCHELR